MESSETKRPSGRAWAWLPVVLLVSLMAIQGVMAMVAMSDPAFAVEPDYYERATHWDDEAARRSKSQALGWSAKVVALTRQRELARLELTLSDATGAPLDADAISAEYFANARAGDRARAELHSVAPGRYALQFRPTRSGLWQFNLEVRRGEDTFFSQVSTDLAPPERR